MIITFLGHSKLNNLEKIQKVLKQTILENVKLDDKIIFYCGGYGDFDNLCVEVCHLLKNIRVDCEIIYVTPYITRSHQEKMNNFISNKIYDSIIYPPIENVPLKYAIIKRNAWMINNADLVISYVKQTYGGAYKIFNYAKRKKKKIINLADIE